MTREEDSIRSLILRLSGLNYVSPKFSRSLERRFRTDSLAFRCRRQWLESWLGLSIYAVLVTAGQILSPNRSRLTYELCFVSVLPLLLLVKTGRRARSAPRLREAAIVVAACILGSAEIGFHLTHLMESSYTAQLMVIAVLVFTNTVVRPRVSYAVATFAWGCAAEWSLLKWQPAGTVGSRQDLELAFFLAIGLLTLISNFGQGRESRLVFLKRVQKEKLVGNLAESNQHLANAAQTDSLTGLANRSALNSYLATIWSDPRINAHVCSFIIIDIDQFKRLNDRYGHIYGDRVVRRVAHLLSEALRGEDDCIARYGGDEFLVLLPRTPVALGKVVAERLRGVIELAGLPAVAAGEPSLGELKATISCGVAGGVPQAYETATTLIEAADQALYQAKGAGRNIVRDAIPVDASLATETRHIDSGEALQRVEDGDVLTLGANAPMTARTM